MKRSSSGLALTCAGLCAGLCALVAGLRADDGNKEKVLRAGLVGTWRLITAKYDGQESNLPSAEITYKHVTPTSFVWLTYGKDTGKISRAGGGAWRLHGDSYTEKIDYGIGSSFDEVKNAEHSFTARLDGDRWYHTGKLADGLTIDEVWERVKPMDPVSAAEKSR